MMQNDPSERREWETVEFFSVRAVTSGQPPFPLWWCCSRLNYLPLQFLFFLSSSSSSSLPITPSVPPPSSSLPPPLPPPPLFFFFFFPSFYRLSPLLLLPLFFPSSSSFPSFPPVLLILLLLPLLLLLDQNTITLRCIQWNPWLCVSVDRDTTDVVPKVAVDLSVSSCSCAALWSTNTGPQN